MVGDHVLHKAYIVARIARVGQLGRLLRAERATGLARCPRIDDRCSAICVRVGDEKADGEDLVEAAHVLNGMAMHSVFLFGSDFIRRMVTNYRGNSLFR